MVKSKCIHLVTPDRKPVTKCGVDTALKTGAAWTMDEEQCTCANCLKLLTGGQMGAPPPITTKPEVSEEDKRRWVCEDRMQRMQRVVDKIDMLKSDVQGLITGIMEEEDVGELVAAHDYMDMAEDRIKTVVAQIQYVLHYEMG